MKVGVGERRRARPAESHALVAGDVDDQGAGCEGREVVVGEERQRGVGVLQNAVDDDVVLREELGQRHAAVLGDRVVHRAGVVVVVEVHDPCGVDRCGDGRDRAVGEDVDVIHVQAR